MSRVSGPANPAAGRRHYLEARRPQLGSRGTIGMEGGLSRNGTTGVFKDLRGDISTALAALLPPLPERGELGHDPMKGAHLLAGQAGALKEVADIAHHAWPLLDIAQETAFIEPLFQMTEEVQKLGLGR